MAASLDRPRRSDPHRYQDPPHFAWTHLEAQTFRRAVQMAWHLLPAQQRHHFALIRRVRPTCSAGQKTTRKWAVNARQDQQESRYRM
eukprot:5827034-Pleurochrysis_carterae.AAC.1